MITPYEILRRDTIRGVSIFNDHYTEADFEREFEAMADDVVNQKPLRMDEYKNFEAIHCSREAGQMLQIIDQGDEQILHIMPDLIAIAKWHKAGRESFFVKPGLCAVISEMDFPRLDWSFVKMPFKAFYVGLGLEIFKLSGTTRFGQYEDDLLGFYFYEHDEKICIVSMAHAEEAVTGELCSWNEFIITKEMLNSSGPINIELVVDNLVKNQMLIVDTQTSLTKREELLEILSFAINMLLYINSSNPEISGVHNHAEPLKNALAKAGKKRRKGLEAELAITSAIPHRDLGRSIVLDKTRPIGRKSLGATGQKLTYRVKVKGHWKRQPYGPKSSQRKHIFVQEYLKGPDTAELISKNYTVTAKHPGEVKSAIERPSVE